MPYAVNTHLNQFIHLIQFGCLQLSQLDDACHYSSSTRISSLTKSSYRQLTRDLLDLHCQIASGSFA